MSRATENEHRSERRYVHAFTFGNFLIGTGVMLAPGLLMVLSGDLGTSVPQTALLITVAAVAMCIGSPVLATLTSRVDRRTVLASSLTLYAIGHALCAFAPSLTVLVVVRTITLLGAAVFTPQAAATLGIVIAPERRAAAVRAQVCRCRRRAAQPRPRGDRARRRGRVCSQDAWRINSRTWRACGAGFIRNTGSSPMRLRSRAITRVSWGRAGHRAITRIMAARRIRRAGSMMTSARS